MFGCIAAGRPVQTNLVQVDSQKYVFELKDAQTINHLVIFLAGELFPPGYGATVHFLWPSQTNPHWAFLGVLTNDKPSAIFKLGGQKTFHRSTDMLTDDDPAFAPMTSTVAQLGISIEPIANVLAQQDMAAQRPSTSNQLTLASNAPPNVIAQKLLQGFYNYCMSFTTALPPNGMVLFNSDAMTNAFIPVKAIQDWYKSTMHKIDTSQLFQNKDMDI